MGFQASSVLRMEPDEDEGVLEDGNEDDAVWVEDANMEEEKPLTDENPFYSSYREAIENEQEEIIQDPLKKEREKRQRQIEEDEAALRKLESENSGALCEEDS